MTPASKAKLLKFFRITHGWLGLIVFPWILVIGLTGLYLNHGKLVLGWIGASEYDESQFAEWPDAQGVSMTDALTLAQSIWPNEAVTAISGGQYHGFESISFTKESGKIIVAQPTGHYFVKTNLTRKTYAPDSTLLHKKIYWSSVFKWLHVRGWLSTTFGTWLADITAGSMVLFSLSGLFMFFMPRAKKITRAVRNFRPTNRRAPRRQRL